MKSKKAVLIIVSVAVVVLLVLAGLNLRSAIRYNYAQNQLSTGRFEQAGEAFAALGGYEESAKLSMYSRACAAAEDGDFYTASRAFSSLGDYKDCKLLAAYYEARQDEAAGEHYTESYLYAINGYNNIYLFRDAQEHIEACREKAYDAADKDGENGDYETAVTVLKGISPYRDSSTLARYYSACDELKKGKYQEALEQFEKLGDYRNSADKLQKTREAAYETAEAYLAKQEYYDAYKLFEALGSYSDAADRIKASKYERADEWLKQGEYERAYALFEELGDYSDAKDRIGQSKYEIAERLLSTKQYDAAYALFAEISDYKDAAERILKSKYARAEACMKSYDFDGAALLYGEIRDYLDAEEKLNSITAARTRKQAEDCKSAGNYPEARALFLELQDEQNANECSYLYADSIESSKPWEAWKEFTALGDYSDSTERAAKLYPQRFEQIGEVDGNGLRIYFDPASGWGLMHENGDIAVEPFYTAIQNGSKGNYMVLVNGKAGVIRPDGGTLADAVYAGISLADHDRYQVKNEEGKYGILDSDGTKIIDCLYPSIQMNEDGTYTVEGEKGEGILKADGSVLIAPAYDGIESMEDGRFLVINNSLQGVLDADGTSVITPAYQSIKLENTGNYIVVLNGKSGIVSHEGKVLHEPDLEEIRTGSNDGKYLIFRQDGLYGFLKADTFEVAVPAEWKAVQIMYDGYAYILNNLNQWGVIDADGKVTVKPQWSDITWYGDCGCAVQGRILRNNKGTSVCDFSEYHNYSKVQYCGNGVFADGYKNEGLYDTKTGKKYAFKMGDYYNVSDLKLYENGLLTGYIPYDDGSWSREYAYGVIDPVKMQAISKNRWDEIASVPGVAKRNNKYGWIGKDGEDLLNPIYDYINPATINGKIVAAIYNDRGNLVYFVIDDTSGKALKYGFATEQEAIDYCGTDSGAAG